MAPDGGQERIVYAINGQYPGPLIEAGMLDFLGPDDRHVLTTLLDWGDTVSVTVKNSLQYNGTSIHWHGISQHNTNSMDGVNGVTECALAPGSSKTYTWQATQYGTTWYHSHHSGQYGDGVYGPMVINGPSTADYDIDLGVLPVTDWYYATATQLDMRMVYGAGPPKADNGLLNGTMVSPDGTQGSYAKTTLQPGKTHRLRLINTSVDNHFMVSLDNHQMTLIQADFVAIEPQVVDWVFIAIGQRYDVLITANETVDNYWFRAEVQTPCGSNNNNGNIKSIFSYEGASDSYPTSNGSSYVGGCSDQTGLVPYVQKDVPSDQFQAQSQSLEMLHDLGTKASWSVNGSSVVQWAFNGEMITINWDKPTLDYVFSGESNFSSSQAIIELPNANEWTFWIINSLPTTSGSAPHPIHLHGHDFYVLGAGDGNFTDASTLNYTNPTRRDVAMLPKAGWLVLAFQTDNPGAWLMHCHIVSFSTAFDSHFAVSGCLHHYSRHGTSVKA